MPYAVRRVVGACILRVAAKEVGASWSSLIFGVVRESEGYLLHGDACK